VTTQRGPTTAVPVASAVVQPQETAAAAQFMASGWVEVPAPRYPIVLTARVTERLAALYVHEGQMVTSGMAVAQLYDGDLRQRADAARAVYIAASNRAARIGSGYRAEDVHAAQATVEEAAERLRATSARFERVQAMLRVQVVSTDEHDTVYSAYRQAQASHAYADAQWRKRSAGYRPEEVEQARAEADAAAASWHLAARAVDQCTLRVPAHPRPLRVLSIARRVGEWITAGDDGDPTVVTLYDPRDLQVRVDVGQGNIGTVRPGQPVMITTEAGGRRRYRGTVLRIEPQANLTKNTMTVRVTVNEPDDLLFPDMLSQVTFLDSTTATLAPAAAAAAPCTDAACADTACPITVREVAAAPAPPCTDASCADTDCATPAVRATIVTQAASQILYVPQAALLHDGTSTWVWVIERGRAQRQAVTATAGDDALAVVHTGLEAGQRVIVNPPALARGQQVAIE
jgi:multidrug resistance efflux pump